MKREQCRSERDKKYSETYLGWDIQINRMQCLLEHFILVLFSNAKWKYFVA